MLLDHNNISSYAHENFFKELLEQLSPDAVFITPPEINNYFSVKYSPKHSKISLHKNFDDSSFFDLLLDNKIKNIENALNDGLFISFPFDFDISKTRTIKIFEVQPKNHSVIIDKSNFSVYKSSIEKFIGLTHNLNPWVDYEFSKNETINKIFHQDLKTLEEFHVKENFLERPLFSFESSGSPTCASHSSDYYQNIAKGKIKYEPKIFSDHAIKIDEKSISLTTFLSKKKIPVINDINGFLMKFYKTLAPHFIMDKFIEKNKDFHDNLAEKHGLNNPHLDFDELYTNMSHSLGKEFTEDYCTPFLKFIGYQHLEKTLRLLPNNKNKFRKSCEIALVENILQDIQKQGNPESTYLNSDIAKVSDHNLTTNIVLNYLHENHIYLDIDNALNQSEEDQFEYFSFAPTYLDIFSKARNFFKFSLMFSKDSQFANFNNKFYGKILSIKVTPNTNNTIYHPVSIGFNKEFNLSKEQKNFILQDFNDFVSTLEIQQIFSSPDYFYKQTALKDKEYSLLFKPSLTDKIQKLVRKVNR